MFGITLFCAIHKYNICYINYRNSYWQIHTEVIRQLPCTRIHIQHFHNLDPLSCDATTRQTVAQSDDPRLSIAIFSFKISAPFAILDFKISRLWVSVTARPPKSHSGLAYQISAKWDYPRLLLEGETMVIRGDKRVNRISQVWRWYSFRN